jgi:hypothetical protein
MSYLYFNELNTDAKIKTRLWEVMNTSTDAVLGRIKFYGAWRKYIFQPLTNTLTLFDAKCLREIADFCEQQTEAWRTEVA